MRGVKLILCGSLDGYVVLCDGMRVIPPTTFDAAAAALRELQAARAFARETLTHLLTKKDA